MNSVWCARVVRGALTSARRRAHKVKDMRKAVSDIKPLVSMAGTIKASPARNARRPASAAASDAGPSSLAARRREEAAMRPASAAGARPAAAAAGLQGAPVDTKRMPRESATAGSTRPVRGSNRPASAMAAAPMRAGEGGEGEYANASPQKDERTNGATANGYYHLLAGNTSGGAEDGVDMIDMYARDEAIGVRPKSRRGRGMNGRGASGVDDQQYLVEEAPQMGDDEMAAAEGDGEMESTWGVGGAYGAYSIDNGSVYALDEAHGTRPKSRRGRGVRSRDGVNMGGVEPQMGDDEAVYHALRTDDRDADVDEEYSAYLGNDMRELDDDMMPKIDEAMGVRPPSRRGRPPSRAAFTHSHLARPGTANALGGAGEFGEVSEAGRELFSDCTTPDAPEEGDAAVIYMMRAHTHTHTHMHTSRCACV